MRKDVLSQIILMISKSILVLILFLKLSYTLLILFSITLNRGLYLIDNSRHTLKLESILFFVLLHSVFNDYFLFRKQVKIKIWFLPYLLYLIGLLVISVLNIIILNQIFSEDVVNELMLWCFVLINILFTYYITSTKQPTTQNSPNNARQP